MSKLITATLLCLSLGAFACSDENDTPDASTNPDAAVTADAGSEPECYLNPTTHREIINACTTSQHVDKAPVLPLLNADGTLPPLP